MINQEFFPATCHAIKWNSQNQVTLFAIKILWWNRRSPKRGNQLLDNYGSAENNKSFQKFTAPSFLKLYMQKYFKIKTGNFFNHLIESVKKKVLFLTEGNSIPFALITSGKV